MQLIYLARPHITQTVLAASVHVTNYSNVSCIIIIVSNSVCSWLSFITCLKERANFGNFPGPFTFT